MTDPFAALKAAQKQGWAHFAPVEAMTTPPAAWLVRRADVQPGQRVLDVACGTGVVAITAARRGAQVTGLDYAAELLARARDSARIAGVAVEWIEGDAEHLPFPEGAFDVVLSQFGHMFAPRADVATAEMLRVLRPGGTIAFSTWPPELFTGRLFGLVGRYMPAPPPGMTPPPLWGDPGVVRERLGSAVTDIAFDRAELHAPALSPAHFRTFLESTVGPLKQLAESLAASDPARLEHLRAELDTLIASYFGENVVRQAYLTTRATKV